MKKTVPQSGIWLCQTLTVLILLFIVGFVSKPVHAQTFDAQKAFQDYQYQQSVYLQSNANFEDARTFYKKNPTLQLQENVREKLLAMLKNRDQFTSVYLTALRLQIVETTGFGADDKAAIYGKIDPEVAWYQNHMTTYNDGDDLATLFTKSDESKNRYQSITKLVTYESLFDISSSQEIGLRLDHQAIYTDLTNFINDQVAQGKLTIDPFNRWLNDTNTVLQTLNQNEALARKKIQTLYTQNYTIGQTYTAAVQILNTSLSPLSQLNNYLIEMLTTLKSQTQ